MNPQVKSNIALFKQVATASESKPLSASAARLKKKLSFIKDNELVSLLKSKKDATLFMSRLNAVVTSNKRK